MRHPDSQCACRNINSKSSDSYRFKMIFLITRKIGSVISSTLGEQYVKNSSTSSAGCPGIAVIDLNPRKVIQ